MFYKITNTLDETLEMENGARLTVGVTYDKKTKAGKNADVVLAFSKAENGWLFNGWAKVDFDMFCDEMTTAELEPLAYRSAIIDLQRDIRPGKSSKKAERVAAYAEWNRKRVDGEITQDEFMAGLPNFIG